MIFDKSTSCQNQTAFFFFIYFYVFSILVFSSPLFDELTPFFFIAYLKPYISIFYSFI